MHTPTDDPSLLAGLCRSAGLKAEHITSLASAGSARRYYRIVCEGGASVIGTTGDNIAENRAFCYLTERGHGLGLPVPELLAVSGDMKSYIQSDLGRRTLYDVMEPARESGDWSGAAKEALAATVAALPDMQFRMADGLDTERCMRPHRMDSRAALWDLNYFKYCFLKTLGIESDEAELDRAFAFLSSTMDDAGAPVAFTLRDCQSRNVMVDDSGRPHWIDYQGGRLAPVTYDVASLLWQARAAIPDEVKKEMTDLYFASMLRYAPTTSREGFDRSLRHMLMLRMLQVLGAYGLRGLVEGKVQFINSIPAALTTLAQLLDEDGDSRLDHLRELVATAARHPWCARPKREESRLIVEVCSFSYKHGMPRYRTDHGGGFVFDCRAPHNPGRYAEYRELTGMDREVIDFLDKDGELPTLVGHATAMVGAAVERYLERGFDSLTVAFGCTGGRHRSVYGAEHLAEAINRKYGVEVRLSHTRLGKCRTLEANKAV